MTYIIKNRTTGEYLAQYEFDKYSKAEMQAIKLEKDSKKNGENHAFIATLKK